MQIHTFNQCSDEWYKLRLGKITGSSFYKLMGTKATQEKYLYDKASEIITGFPTDNESYTNIHIDRGKQLEDIAREKYSDASFYMVDLVGLVEFNKYLACSPDGLIKDDGMIEIKIPDSNNYLKQIMKISEKGENGIPKEHYLQMQFNLYILGRKWCDYILYNTKHDAIGSGLFFYTVKANPEVQSKITKVVEESINKIKSIVDSYNIIMSNRNYK